MSISMRKCYALYLFAEDEFLKAISDTDCEMRRCMCLSFWG